MSLIWWRYCGRCAGEWSKASLRISRLRWVEGVTPSNEFPCGAWGTPPLPWLWLLIALEPLWARANGRGRGRSIVGAGGWSPANAASSWMTAMPESSMVVSAVAAVESIFPLSSVPKSSLEMGEYLSSSSSPSSSSGKLV